MSSSWIDEYAKKEQATKSSLKDVIERNKAVIFPVLEAAGIAKVEARFDGEGDSGQFEEAEAYGKDQARIPFPPVDVTVEIVQWGGKVQVKTTEIQDAIQEVSWSILEAEHAGWENNDGAFGTFTFDTAEKTIEFEYNWRITTSQSETDYY